MRLLGQHIQSMLQIELAVGLPNSVQRDTVLFEGYV